jgi:hypothetical protein
MSSTPSPPNSQGAQAPDPIDDEPAAMGGTAAADDSMESSSDAF